MPNSLFEVNATDVAALDQSLFVELCNRLLRATTLQIGLRPDQVQDSLRTNDNDGGADARVVDILIDNEAHDSERTIWIPAGTSAWQFKSGAAGDPSQLKKEFAKPEVQEVLDANGSYVVILAEDLTPRKKKTRLKALQDCCDEKGIPHVQCRIYCAGDLAQWVEQYPALILWSGWRNRPQASDWMNWEDLSNLQRFKGVFKSDSQRDGIISDVVDMALASQPIKVHRRIEGFAGVGKTRLAIEIIRQLTAGDRTIYAGRPNDVPGGFWNWVRTQQRVKIILIVDECLRDESDRLTQQAEACNGKVRLITIGLTPEARDRAASDLLRLDTLKREAMLEVIAEVAPTLFPAARDYVEKAASGYVKLGVALAKALADELAVRANINDSPEAYLRPLIAHSEVNSLIQKLLPNEQDRMVMSAIALLPQTGWEDEIEDEGKITTRFCGIEWRDAKRRAGQLVRDGYIAKSGRYRYVTPHILAVHLAGQVWEDMGAEVLDLLPELPSLMARRGLLERLQHLGDEPRARATVVSLLDANGLFPSIDSLNDEFRSEIFGILAVANHQAGMHALDRLMEHLPRDALMEFRSGRRNIVWTLEKLAWWPETFFAAARLLLRLAEAENETWGNNASGIWPALFATHLGGTAVPALQRHPLISEALDANSVSVALLAVKAIARVLSGHEHRTHGAEFQGGRVVPDEWHPATWDDVWDAKKSGLRLLDKALSSPFEEVKENARKLLIDMGREVIAQGLFDEVFESWQRLSLPTYEERRELLDQIEMIVDFDGDRLEPQQKGKLNDLARNLSALSFSDRLHRMVGPRSWHDAAREMKDSEQYTANINQEAIALVEEANADPSLLRAELPFLAEQNGYMLWPFISHLGEADQEFYWWNEILPLVRTGKGYELAAGYLRAQSSAGRSKKREELLDQWLPDPSMAKAALRVILNSPDGFNDTEARRVIYLLRSGRIAPSEIGRIFPTGQSTRGLSLHVLIELLDALQIGGEKLGADEMVLSLFWIYDHLKNVPSEFTQLSPFFWKAIEFPELPITDLAFHAREENSFEPWLSAEPKRIAKVMLNVLERRSFGQSEQIALATLRRAVQIDPKGLWEIVGERLLNPTKGTYSLVLSLENFTRWWDDPELILSWVREGPKSRAGLVAQITSLGSTVAEEESPNTQNQSLRRLNDLARGLLSEFGDEKYVASSLSGKFTSGSWIGPMSNYLKSKLVIAKEWAQDPDSAVSRWAQTLVRSLEEQIQHAELREEEERLLMGLQ